MITLWNLIFYKPLYNALFFLVDVVPNNSLFIAVVILTIIVRLIISPLSLKAIKTQLKTKLLAPKLKEIKKIEDKQEQAKKTLELYKEHGVNPFSSFALILIQLPIILALYWVFRDGGIEVDPSILYSFVQEPMTIVKDSFGLDLTQKSLILAFLTGLTQYIYLSTASTMKKDESVQASGTEQEKMMQMVQQSMKYMMPVMITIFAYIIGGAVALYWVTSNIFMIAQERYIQAKLKKNPIS